MDATMKGAVFSDEDFNKEYGKSVTKHDARSGRTISHVFAPRGGHMLSISGRGITGIFYVSMDGEYVNMIARVLLDAEFDERLKL